MTATTPDGKFIASSDVDGWFENLGGNATVHLSQIAYKPLTVGVADIVDGKVMLEEASYDLPDVVVKPKELLYCQTYYRLVYLNEDGPLYYRGGVIDNTYDIAKKKVSAKSTHLSRGEKPIGEAFLTCWLVSMTVCQIAREVLLRHRVGRPEAWHAYPDRCGQWPSNHCR